MCMTPQKLWFKAKRYGWGWYPVTWQGWLVIIMYTLFITHRAVVVSAMFDTETSALFRYFFEMIIPTILLLWVCYKKGEKPRWRWGK